MQRSKITEMVEDFTFELATGVATLHVERRPEGTTMLLVGPAGAGACRPSDLGIVGFDASWEPGFTTAYDVPDEEVQRLVRALETLEGGERVADDTPKGLVFDVQDLASDLWAYHVAIAADGSRAIAGGPDGRLRAWDLATGEERTLDGHTGIVDGAAVSADGTMAATCGTDDMVMVWDLATGTRVLALEGQLSMPSGMGLSADGSRLVHVTKDGMLHLRDAGSGEELSSLFVGEAYVLAVSADATRAVCVSENASRVWDLVGSTSLGTLEGLTGRGIRVALSADGAFAVSRAPDDPRPVRIWDTATGRELFGFPGDYIWGIAIAGDGTRVMAFGTDVTREETDEDDEETVDTLRVWDARSGAELLGHREADIPTVGEVAMTADGSMAVTCDGSNRIRLWRFSTGPAEPASEPVEPEAADPVRPVLTEDQVREAEDW
jgi:WD40 repeat protein